MNNKGIGLIELLLMIAAVSLLFSWLALIFSWLIKIA